MKIGVISHTQQLETIDDLPARARLALADVDLVLHVGNVGSLSFLRSLQDAYGLTFAIYGSADSDEVKRFLEVDKVVEFANRRIGMVFGVTTGESNLKFPSLKRQTITPDRLSAQLLTHFEKIDCLVFGAPAGPFNYIYQGTLIFNPGPLKNGSIGILEITERAMTGRVVAV